MSEEIDRKSKRLDEWICPRCGKKIKGQIDSVQKNRVKHQIREGHH